MNDLATTHPALAAQWHPTRNGDLTAKQVSYGSSKKAWWVCDEGHEWAEQVVGVVSRRSACRECWVAAGKPTIYRPQPGVNDLATTHPSVAAQWHPTRNGDFTPQQVSYGSSKKAWWLCPQGHEWEARVSKRTNGAGCLRCRRQRS